MHPPLHDGFLRAAARMPNRVALVVQGQTLTFADLRQRAASLAATMQHRAPDGGPPLTAVFADRSPIAFSGVLGALLAGRGYVPLNPHFPVAKTRQLLERAGCRLLVVDAAAQPQLETLLNGINPTLVLLPDEPDVRALAERWPQHTFVGQLDMEPESSWTPAPTTPDAIAYLLFTSGSTGTPKGVMVSHRNAVHFVRNAAERYGVTPDDRFSQMFDLTFDLSVFDMFVAWERGACVCCPSRTELWNPDRFVRDQALTVWFSVPSLAMLMLRVGSLKPGRFPSLRWSLFCGERLLAETAAAWAAAAPASTLENLYGPTELTVACTAYRWDAQRSPAECEHGVVPIGDPLPGMRAIVVDEGLCEVPPGEAGELLVAGPQRTPGYWHDDPATARAHVNVPGQDTLFYRTGDRVRRPAGQSPLLFLGRADQQIKIHGHRVELGEVESTLMEVPGVTAAAAIGWPAHSAGVNGIAAFVAGYGLEPTAIRTNLQARLQAYAVPATIRVLHDLPLNMNGKVDRHALVALLER